MAGHGLAEPGDGFFPAPDLPGQPDDGPVRLELGKGRFEDLPGAGPAELRQEVDGHVVRGPETGVQRVGPPRGEAGDGGRIRAGLPQHDGVALDVDAATPGAARQLGVLPRRDVDMGLAVELVQLLQHDAAGRHVDAKGKRFGGEDGLDQPVDEQLLHDLLEGRQHPGVVRGETAQQAVPPAPETEHIEVIRGDVLGGLVDALGDDLLFPLGGQPESGRDALGHGGIAAGAGEDERDGRQEVLPVQAGDDLRPAGLPHRAALGALRFVPLAALVSLLALVPAAVAEAATEIHLALGPCHGQQFGVDLEAGPPGQFGRDGGRGAAPAGHCPAGLAGRVLSWHLPQQTARSRQRWCRRQTGPRSSGRP